jgi:hypothetical protein
MKGCVSSSDAIRGTDCFSSVQGHEPPSEPPLRGAYLLGFLSGESLFILLESSQHAPRESSL